MNYPQAMKISRSEQDAREARWQAEGDAECLAQALAIQQDPERMKNAKLAAVELAKRERERIERRKKEAVNMENLAKVGQSESKRMVTLQTRKGIPSDFPTEIVTPQKFNRNLTEEY